MGAPAGQEGGLTYVHEGLTFRGDFTVTATTETYAPSHPSRAEWAARQEGLPPGARVVLEARRRKAAGDSEAAFRAERAEFEARLDAALEAEGANWLKAYRVAAVWVAAVRLGAAAWFDGSRVGLWPVSLHPGSGAKWHVHPPTGEVRMFDRWHDALEYAAQYVSTPF